jgi:hypothetical protein
VGLLDERLSNSDDVDFFFRVARLHNIGYIDEVLHKRRIHAKNISSRPEALAARLSVRHKLYHVDLTYQERRALAASISRIHYSLGFVHKKRGDLAQARRHFLKSWLVSRRNWKALKSWLGAWRAQ